MAEYIEREAAIEKLNRLCDRVCQYSKAQRKYMCGACPLGDAFTVIEDNIPAADVRPVPDGGIGEMSDGYHTFNGLYYQRMVLFAALVKAHKDKAWKSWKHEEGEPCFGGGWFIVGIDTPQGSYTYHYDKMYWNLFECEELAVAKHWDGHTEEDVTRLLSLDVRPVEWIPVTDRLPEAGERVLCYCRANIYEVMKMRTDGDWVYDTNHVYMHSFVTHWMPLPEPPKEENEQAKT